MIIKQVEIYGYGKISNETLLLEKGLNVHFGKNEAGKTTWMEFIRHVIYGFPTRAMSERRYEPKQGGTCGGSILLETKEFGLIKLERVLTAHKASGALKITDKEGNVLPEQVYNSLIRGMDELTFKNIYHFGVDGLQNLHMKKGEELSKYLFSTSLFGQSNPQLLLEQTDRLMKGLLKQRGKAEINDRLGKLSLLKSNQKEREEREEKYASTIEEKMALEQKVKEHKHKLDEIENRINRLLNLQSIRPLILEHDLHKRRLEQLGYVKHLPDNLEATFEEFEAQENRLREHLLEAEMRLSQIETICTGAYSDFKLRRDLPEFLKDQRVYEEDLRNLALAESKNEEYKVEVNSLLSTLGKNVSEEFIRSLPHFFHQREELKKAVGEMNELKKNIQLNRIQGKQFLQDIDEMKSKISVKRLGLLKEDEVRERLRIKKELYEVEELGKKVTLLRKQKEQLELDTTLKKRTPSTHRLWLLSISLMSIMGGLYSYNKEMLMLIPLFILFPIFTVALLKGQNASGDKLSNQSLYRILDDQICELETEISKGYGRLPNRTSEEIHGELEADGTLRSQIDTEEQWLNRSISTSLRQENQLNQLRFQLKELENWLKTQCAQFSMRDEDFGDFSVEFLDQCYTIKEIYTKMDVVESKIEELKATNLAFINKWKEYTLDEWEQPFHIEALKLSIENKIRHTQSDQLRFANLSDEYLELGLGRKVLLRKLDLFNEEKQAFMGELNLRTELEVEGMIEGIKQYKEVLQSYQSSVLRLDQMKESYDLSGDMLHIGYNVDEQIELLKKDKSEILYEVSKYEEYLNEMRAFLYHVEEESRQVDLNQEYEKSKEDAKAFMKEWLILSCMKKQLSAVGQVFKEEKLPRTLKLAQQYFKDLTNGMYVEIHLLTNEDTFVVHNKDGIIFSVDELSKGTQEQLYVSLRFALASTHHTSNEMPLILDDPFVNFDKDRLEKVIRTLEKMGDERQIILFTCHEHVVNHFLDQKMIQLGC